MDQQRKKVFVGLSGGVDSSVAALRLIKQGFDVYGVFIKVWQPDWLKCDWEQERLDAMRVAAKLDIPFLTCNAEKEYKDEVADYFISEYKAGRTPNPDVMCNKYVKFGAFLKFAEAHGADFVATGHYAQRLISKDSEPPKYELHRGVDSNKDQTYFLWTLNQKQLSKILLPVGDSTKSVIRQEAEKAELITAEKKDSQGVCFLGHIDIPEFLSHYCELTPGPVLNEAGEVIGEHEGALVYTDGQRHGFTINSTESDRTPHFVISRDLEKNVVVVSKNKPTIMPGKEINLHSLNLLVNPEQVLDEIEIQTRYRQTPITAKVSHIQNDSMTLLPQVSTESVSAGQSCVLYKGNNCLGGGIIS